MTTIKGRRINLGSNKKKAEKEFHRLMSEEKAPQDNDAVVSILDDFLDWTQENRAPRTYKGHLDFCTSFCKMFGTLPISELTSAHVTAWIKTKPTWNSTTKRNAITSIMRALSVELGCW